MLNLNPELVNQDKIRKAKRKRMLKYAFLPCLILLLASAFVFRIGIFNLVYSISYRNQNFEIANSMTDAQSVGNFISPYIKYYDGGTAKIRMRDYKEAEADLRASLKENPPANYLCQIYTNLSLSIELQGDELFGRGNYQEALDLYAKAQSTLYSNNCANKNDDEGTDSMAKNGKQRLDGKLSKTMKKINSIEDDPDGDNGTPVTDGINEQQKKALENRRNNQDNIYWNIRNGGYGSSSSSCGSYDICW